MKKYQTKRASVIKSTMKVKGYFVDGTQFSSNVRSGVTSIPPQNPPERSNKTFLSRSATWTPHQRNIFLNTTIPNAGFQTRYIVSKWTLVCPLGSLSPQPVVAETKGGRNLRRNLHMWRVSDKSIAVTQERCFVLCLKNSSLYNMPPLPRSKSGKWKLW